MDEVTVFMLHILLFLSIVGLIALIVSCALAKKAVVIISPRAQRVAEQKPEKTAEAVPEIETPVV